jgi:hypothetical protein
MTTPDPIVAYTIRDMRTLACPLCPHTIDVPPVRVSDAIGEALGMSGATLAAVHAEQVLKRATAEMRTHLEGHSIVEWLSALAAAGEATRG